MNHYLYILYSTKINKYYIGYSSDTSRRLEEHNSSKNKNWTQRGQPWELKVSISYNTESAAKKAERKLKNLKSRKVIEEVIKTGKFY
jgi:putative endonuclease